MEELFYEYHFIISSIEKPVLGFGGIYWCGCCWRWFLCIASFLSRYMYSLSLNWLLLAVAGTANCFSFDLKLLLSDLIILSNSFCLWLFFSCEKLFINCFWCCLSAAVLKLCCLEAAVSSRSWIGSFESSPRPINNSYS